jgi:translation initiation factor 5
MSNKVNIGRVSNQDTHYRYQMEKMTLQTVNRHGFKTIWKNINAIARDLNTQPTYLNKFFNLSLGLKCNYDEKEGMSVNSKQQIPEEKFKTVLNQFIEQMVLCKAPTCHLPECDMLVNEKSQVLLNCAACGHESRVKANEKMLAFVVKNPPPPKKHIQIHDPFGFVLPAHNTTVDQAWSDEETSPTEKLKEFLENADKLSTKIVLARVRELAEEYSLDDKQVVCLMFESFFNESIEEQASQYASAMRKFVKNSATQKIVLGYVEELVGVKHPDLMKRVPAILQALYDEKLIQDKSIQAWYEKTSSRFVNSSVAADVRAAAKPFVESLLQ